MFECYKENCFKANADKSPLFLSPFYNKEMTVTNYNTASRNSEELSGIVIENVATFAKHFETFVARLIKKSMHWGEILPSLICHLYNCVTAENLIDYKNDLFALYTMINAQLFIGCWRKTNQ